MLGMHYYERVPKGASQAHNNIRRTLKKLLQTKMDQDQTNRLATVTISLKLDKHIFVAVGQLLSIRLFPTILF